MKKNKGTPITYQHLGKLISFLSILFILGSAGRFWWEKFNPPPSDIQCSNEPIYLKTFDDWGSNIMPMHLEGGSNSTNQ
jgi:hypothetical protein